MNTRVVGLRLLPLVLFAACASELPTTPAAAEGITTLAEVVLLGDDLAALDGVRMPLDEVVLRLRWRVRAMDAQQRAAFGVHVKVGPELTEAATAQVLAAKSRLFDELDVMDVGYVKT